MRSIILFLIVAVAMLSLGFAQSDTEIVAPLHRGLHLNLFTLFLLGFLAIFLVVVTSLYGVIYFWEKSSSTVAKRHGRGPRG
jgi:hypothetical protein